jgi:hypothetical protein
MLLQYIGRMHAHSTVVKTSEKSAVSSWVSSEMTNAV